MRYDPSIPQFHFLQQIFFCNWYQKVCKNCIINDAYLKLHNFNAIILLQHQNNCIWTTTLWPRAIIRWPIIMAARRTMRHIYFSHDATAFTSRTLLFSAWFIIAMLFYCTIETIDFQKCISVWIEWRKPHYVSKFGNHGQHEAWFILVISIEYVLLLVRPSGTQRY